VTSLPIPFKVKVVRIGASLRITIPKPIAEHLNIKEGDTVILVVENSEIRVKKQPKEEKKE
jgi:AbrB family looped-hinge helix DNA binding protein